MSGFVAVARFPASAIFVAACAGASAQAQNQAEKLNLELVGYHDLRGRGAYQLLAREFELK